VTLGLQDLAFLAAGSVSGPRLWTFADATTELWVRPDDAATVTIATGTSISGLADKSGSGRNFTGATGSQPTLLSNALNSKAALALNGSQWLTSASSAATWNFLHTTGGIIVAAWKAGNSSNPNALYALLGNNALLTGSHGFSLFYDDRSSATRNDRVVGQVTRGVSGVPTTLNISSDDAHPPSQPVIVTHIFDPGNAVAAKRSILRVNGTSIELNTSTNAASSANATNPLQIGAAGGNANPLVGELYEIGIFPLSAGLATVERAEGYLAGPTEWNLQSMLAAGHPFKSYPPMI
jgi:hypothetical protein